MMFCLPGAFWHYDLWREYIDTIYPSIFYDGVNCCTWNGGRSNVLGNNWDDKIAQEYVSRGHTLALTFSNEFINFDDEIGDKLLGKLNDIHGYVILRNHFLARRIRIVYPKIRIIYSITGVQKEYSFDFYYNILKWCDYIVPRWHHLYKLAKDFSLLRDRFEVMINHSCPSECPYWEKHYTLVDEVNRTSTHISKTYDNPVINCLIDEKLTDSFEIDIQRRMKYVTQLGFTRFKLAGREFPKDKLKSHVEKILPYMKNGE